MKPYAKILHSIDIEFEKALQELKSDPVFLRTDGLYSTDDKARISKIWKKIVKPFGSLKKIIRSMYWRSFFGFWNKNSFVVQYASITTYYNMVYELRESFGDHEEFLRQYLDDTFRENYSTLARYMYHIRFYTILIYPREYFLTLRDEVDPSLSKVFDRPERSAGKIEKRFSHDWINIWYYFRYRITLVISWISKRFGMFISHIYFSRRDSGRITTENLEKIFDSVMPGDIIISRRNWAATNVSIPGFWKHMSMYIGTGEYLKKEYKESVSKNLLDTTHYIIEAVWTGVHIAPIQELAFHNDYLGVMRTRFSSARIQRAIQKTLTQVDVPYDFSFNYYSDANHVCSALITKSYLPEYGDDEWLHITLCRIATGITYPPNDILKKINDEYWTNEQELDFVAFIDSIEKTGENYISTEKEFLATINRPRLSFLLS